MHAAFFVLIIGLGRFLAGAGNGGSRGRTCSLRTGPCGVGFAAAGAGRAPYSEYEGTSWVGVVPFRMSGVMRRPFPDMPGISASPELNLRLYVSGMVNLVFGFSVSTRATGSLFGRRGVFPSAVFSRAHVVRARGPRAELRLGAHWRAAAGAFWSELRAVGRDLRGRPGTLEHFFTERYCLYARGRVVALLGRGPSPPLAASAAEADIGENELAAAHGFRLSGAPALFHFARRLDVVVWPPMPLP